MVVDAHVRRGTRDLAAEPALTRAEAVAAVEAGIGIAARLIDGGTRCLLTGDMGIANTTPAAALIAAFTGADPATVTGRGTGIDDATYARKVAVVAAALRRHAPHPADPLSVLDNAQLAFLELIGSRLVQVSSAYQPGPEVVADLRGTYARWFAGHGLRAVVTRPDYYVFGGAVGLEDLPAVIDSLRCQLGPRTEAPATAAAATAG